MTASLPGGEIEAALRRAAHLAARLVLSHLASRGGRSGLAIHAVRLSLSEGTRGGEAIEIAAWPPESSGAGAPQVNASAQSAAGNGR